MKPIDLIHETFLSLTANKIRTGLTMLGIVIGISSVIAMVSIGQGAQSSVESSIQSIGSNLISVFPGAQRGPGNPVSSGRGSAKTLTMDDAQALSGLASVKAVSPELSGRYQITAKGTNTNTSVQGVMPVYPEVRNIAVETGSFFADGQARSLAKVAVIGPTTKTDLFGDNEAIGQMIRIKGVQFKVIGVTAPKGGSGFGNQDDMIYVPLPVAQKFLAGDEYLSTISVQAVDAESMGTAQTEITDILLARHKISDPTAADFNIFNQADIVATASSITETFTLLLGAVAGISLLVGGIGIMNMMLTTVTERTKEIGLRKAVGARETDIRKQFLAEAVVLTLVSGAIGVALGWGVSWGINTLGLIQTTISLSSVLIAFGVSALIGIVFGYYPASRAAALDPIDALRYE